MGQIFNTKDGMARIPLLVVKDGHFLEEKMAVGNGL
jgi:hypothetical protein